MGRCWTWYASIGGSTRPIPLSKGAGVWCISSHVTTTYHCWVVLCPLKMPLGKYVARHPRGCGMCVTGTVDQALLLRNEYLATENRILRNQITGRVRLSDGERKTLAEMGQKLGKKALAEVATIVKPDTILAWHRTLVAQKFDGSQQRQSPGRPTIGQELEALIVRMAQDN